MDKDYIKGLKIGAGFITILGILFGIVFAVGFHTAEEILGGTFSGNFVFDDNVTFNGDVNGINSGGSISEMQIYTTPGTYTWTVPAGVTKIRVKVAGGGGGGAADSFQSGSVGSQSSFTDNGINIIANGGQQGFAIGSQRNGPTSGSGSGGTIIQGGGSAGGSGISFAASDDTQDGMPGGLVINTTSTSQGLSYTVTVGAGGNGGSGGNTASSGADGYVIIEY